MMTGVESKPGWPAWRETALWLFCGLALVYLYGISGDAQSIGTSRGSAILWMVQRWSGSGGDLSHGWLIPLVSGYVIWLRREALRAAPRERDGRGLLLVVGCLLLHWIGYRSQLTRLSLLSLVGLTWAVPLYLYGYAFARHLVFPCSYLIFCIPLSFLDSVTVPLRRLMSVITAGLLNGLGISAVRHGTIIETQAGGGFLFDVADPCSGLRSLLAMTALTAVYAVLTQRTLLRRWILFLSAVPLAVLGNIVRILAIALLVQVADPEFALGFYHDYSGYLVFVVAILCMVAVGAWLRRERLLVMPWRERPA